MVDHVVVRGALGEQLVLHQGKKTSGALGRELSILGNKLFDMVGRVHGVIGSAHLNGADLDFIL